jgi:hypothetical protein
MYRQGSNESVNIELLVYPVYSEAENHLLFTQQQLYFRFPSSITQQKHPTLNMKSILAATVALLLASASASVVFSLSTEPNGQGVRKSWVVDRWKCKDLAAEGIDDQASWAFVDAGLANGCELYE